MPYECRGYHIKYVWCMSAWIYTIQSVQINFFPNMYNNYVFLLLWGELNRYDIIEKIVHNA